MNKKLLSKFLVIVLLFIFQHSFASETRIVKVGAFDSFPLIFRDKDGVISGLYTDLLSEIGQKENIRFEYVFGTWQDGLDHIRTGEVDMLTSVGYTDERSLYMDYCNNPLLTVWGELYTLKSSDINGIFEIKNKRVGALRSDIFLKNFVQLTSKLGVRYELIEFESYDDVLKAVAAGTVDGGIVDVTFGAARQREYGLRSSGIVFNPLDIFFTTGKGKNRELRVLLDKHLGEWKHQDVSAFSTAKHKWLYGSVGAVAVMPGWLIYTMIILSILTAVAFLFAALLKLQVQKAADKIAQREEALRKSEDDFKSIIDTIPVAIHLTTGVEQISRYVNPAMEKLFGYTIEDIPSVEQWWPLAYPDKEYRKKISDEWNNKVRRAIETQSPIEPMEVVVNCKDGSRKNILWGFITLGDRNYSCGLDLTERKQAEAEVRIKNEELEAINEELNAAVEEMEAANEEIIATSEELQMKERDLRESEEKFRSLVWDMKVGVLLQGPEAEILLSNPKALELLGMSEDQLLGKTSLDPDWNVIHEDGTPFPGESHPVPEAIAKRHSVSEVVMGVYRPSTGDRVWLLVDAEPQLNDDGTVRQVVCTFIDITSRKSAEEKIKNLLVEKELLLQEVHHRIKNNMNTIKGLLTLQLAAEENDSAAASLRDAESRVQSMIMLYDRLYCTDNYRELPVKDYLQSLAEEIIGSFPNRGIVKIETEIEDFILNINILTPLGIVLNELLTNMMKYAFHERESGILKLTAAVENNRVRIIVEDNGVGIPDSVTLDRHSGFGLDLVWMLVDQIGGRITVERGDGTKFVLEFDV